MPHSRIYPLALDRVIHSVREGRCSTIPAEAVRAAQAFMRASDRRGPGALACETWADHAWDERQVSFGKDAVRGRYEVYALRCGRCAAETTETRWPDIPNIPLPQGAEGSHQ